MTGGGTRCRSVIRRPAVTAIRPTAPAPAWLLTQRRRGHPQVSDGGRCTLQASHPPPSSQRLADAGAIRPPAPAPAWLLTQRRRGHPQVSDGGRYPLQASHPPPSSQRLADPGAIRPTPSVHFRAGGQHSTVSAGSGGAGVWVRRGCCEGTDEGSKQGVGWNAFPGGMQQVRPSPRHCKHSTGLAASGEASATPSWVGGGAEKERQPYSLAASGEALTKQFGVDGGLRKEGNGAQVKLPPPWKARRCLQMGWRGPGEAISAVACCQLPRLAPRPFPLRCLPPPRGHTPAGPACWGKGSWSGPKGNRVGCGRLPRCEEGRRLVCIAVAGLPAGCCSRGLGGGGGAPVGRAWHAGGARLACLARGLLWGQPVGVVAPLPPCAVPAGHQTGQLCSTRLSTREPSSVPSAPTPACPCGHPTLPPKPASICVRPSLRAEEVRCLGARTAADPSTLMT